MSFNIGVLNAAVTLDNSDFKRKAGEVPQVAESNFRKVAELAAAYLTFRGLFSFVKTATMSFSALENAAWNFDQTFKAIPGTAAEVEQRMRELYKLSEQTSKGMLSSVGDQLQAFGMGAEDSLLWAEQIAKRGIDLASYKGGNQADAVSDITKALIGETEGMKKWGVVIRQSSKEFTDMVERIQRTTGVTEELAKAQAIFEIILKQSANAEGDYLKEGANIAQTLANIRQQTLEATSSMGAHLSSGVRPMLEGYEKLLGKFNELDPAGQKVVMQLAAMSAALILLQTNLGKTANAKVASLAADLMGNAKQEAAAVAASERQKELAATRSAATREALENKRHLIVMQNAAREAAAVVSAEKAKRSAAMSVGPLDEKKQKALDQSVIAAENAYAAAKGKVTVANKAYVASSAAAKAAGAAEAVQTKIATAANVELAASKTLVGRAAIFLSGSLKAATASVSAFFASIGPIGWIVIGITAIASALSFVGREAEKAAEKAKKAADAAAAATEKNYSANQKVLSGMQRLKELAGYNNLNQNEQKEAQRLLEEIGLSYEKNGIRIDTVTGKIITEKEALEDLIAARKEELKQKRIATLEEEMAKNKASAEANDQKKTGAWGAFWRGIPGISALVDSPEEIDEQIDEQSNLLRERNDAIRQEIKDLKDDKIGVEDKGAASGDTKEQRAARENLENARLEKDMDGASAAQQDKILKQKADELRIKLFDSAENKAEADYTKEELEIAKQIVDLERQRAEIRKKSADAFKDEAENFSQSEERRARENERRQTDREISKLESEQGGDAVKKRMEQELQKARESAERMKAEYDKAIKDAQEDGVLTDEERKQIQEARRKLDDAMSDEDTWTNKLADYEAKDHSNAKAAVAFSSDMLTAMIGASPTDKAIEKNTKQSVDIQRDSKKLLEDIKNKPNSTVLK